MSTGSTELRGEAEVGKKSGEILERKVQKVSSLLLKLAMNTGNPLVCIEGTKKRESRCKATGLTK